MPKVRSHESSIPELPLAPGSRRRSPAGRTCRPTPAGRDGHGAQLHGRPILRANDGQR
ncbi:MAG: hypothetical protein AVDCRST_MAG19-2636 [uncultured Thermomicrobiales bacterium]|uniref:Uncharacterized protein n=1 Tax=uncultured Thermomicrobiales bacterium TaxID=1645740 RepID=A0A6J4V5X3_9BACT|nr:MAG: hypothetical protein AVDCRST_MAG19-2636 [uncultured Thermomicrobiales bacterium]